MIKSYQLDQNGFFLYENPDYDSQPSLSVLVAPPFIPNGKLARWNTNLNPITAPNYGAVGTGVWELLDDNRGKTVFDLTTGEEYEGDYDGVGSLPSGTTLLAPSESGMSWDGTKWILTPEKAAEKQALALAAAKSQKLQEINFGASAYANDLARLDETPEFERSTWPIQAEEATKWHADNQVETSILSIIATERGVPINVLRQRAYEKAMNYYALSASLAGQRQRYEDLLTAATTIEQVEAIQPVYQVSIHDDEIIEQEV